MSVATAYSVFFSLVISLSSLFAASNVQDEDIPCQNREQWNAKSKLVFSNRLHQMQGVLGLSEKQQQKLRVVSKGLLKKLDDAWDAKQHEFMLTPFESEFWKKNLAKSISEEQQHLLVEFDLALADSRKKSQARYQADRNDLDALLQLASANARSNLLLTPKQGTSMDKLLAEYVQGTDPTAPATWANFFDSNQQRLMEFLTESQQAFFTEDLFDLSTQTLDSPVSWVQSTCVMCHKN